MAVPLEKAYINSAGTLVPGGIKPSENQNEVGLAIGGPIIQNKLFLFYNYGQYREAAGPNIQSQTAPTCAMMGYCVGSDGNCGAALGYANSAAGRPPPSRASRFEYADL